MQSRSLPKSARPPSARGNLYAVSDTVFAAAKIEPPAQDIVNVACGPDDENVSVYFMDTVQLPAQDATLRNRMQRAATTVMDQLRG